jgi:hypothetical protein
MMNAEDAMGLQEDLARIGRRPTPAVDRLPAPDESGNAVAAAVVAIRARNDTMGKLRHELDSTKSERNEVAVLAKAARDTIDALARELARQTDTPVEECLRLAQESLSRRYDVLLDDAIRQRQVLRDVRKIPEEMQNKRWYSPAV